MPTPALRWLRVPVRWATAPTGGAVEVVLTAAEGRVDLVVSALRDDNPGPDLSVVDRGHDVVVRAPRCLVLTTATLAWHLGRGFDLRRLRPMVVSWVGRMDLGPEEVVWTSPVGPGGCEPLRGRVIAPWRRTTRHPDPASPPARLRA